MLEILSKIQFLQKLLVYKEACKALHYDLLIPVYSPQLRFRLLCVENITPSFRGACQNYLHVFFNYTFQSPFPRISGSVTLKLCPSLGTGQSSPDDHHVHLQVCTRCLR